MSRPLTRRRFIAGSIATAAGAMGLGGALQLARRNGLIPPDYQGVYGFGETLTYASQRLLMSSQSLAREFSRSEISKVAEINGTRPEDETYQRLLAGNFLDWPL